MSATGSDGEHTLQDRFGTRARAQRFYDNQVLDRLNQRMTDFVVRMDMAFFATADRHGNCDSSFRAGEPGFLRVLDEHTLAYPEYRGNGVLASLGNLLENPHKGILLIDFLQDMIGLHINGSASIFEDTVLRERMLTLPSVRHAARAEPLWGVVDVDEAYIHCRKHIPHPGVCAPRPRLGHRRRIGQKAATTSTSWRQKSRKGNWQSSERIKACRTIRRLWSCSPTRPLRT
ncbi:pyridoxamine 5'-phosphate oxidase family protein [Nocardia grenadensis]|uniref:pyridoxamine 5'-phosphate oxidase family protein n=1 Tax=Nocardia grenadensis TaxID=931537 RepID=UPI003D7376A3